MKYLQCLSIRIQINSSTQPLEFFLRKVEAKLPPGFRFHPRDEELVCDYLTNMYTSCECSLMIEVDLNKCEPWDIPESARVGGKEWYFYSQRDRKYASGLRTNRATVSGYWKATGKDKAVFRRGTLVGMRKTLVFYQGRAPKGRKTNWVMHEFRLEGPLAPPKIPSLKGDWVLCRVCNKDVEVDAKQGIGSGYDDKASLSLPPLLDSYITFDQTNISKVQQFEHVPCFSDTFSPNYKTNPIFSDITHVEPIKVPTPTFNLGGRPEIITSYCEKSAIKSVLNHLTKKGSTSLGEGIMAQSFISNMDLPIMWNQY